MHPCIIVCVVVVFGCIFALFCFVFFVFPETARGGGHDVESLAWAETKPQTFQKGKRGVVGT